MKIRRLKARTVGLMMGREAKLLACLRAIPEMTDATYRLFMSFSTSEQYKADNVRAAFLKVNPAPESE